MGKGVLSFRPPEQHRSLKFPFARVITSARQKRTVLPTAHGSGNSPGSGAPIPESIRPFRAVRDRREASQSRLKFQDLRRTQPVDLDLNTTKRVRSNQEIRPCRLTLS